MKKILFVFLISAFTLVSCEDILINDNPSDSQNSILFQYEVINYAWAFTHYGYFITNDGKIHGFDKPKNWTFIDTLEKIDQSILEKNLSQSSEILGILTENQINSMKSKIAAASNGKIIDEGWVMADAGFVIYRAFIFNKSSGEYEKVLIKQLGDYQKVNQSVYSDSIYYKMKEIALDHYSWTF